MEGNIRNGRRIRVHREFECSRLEQAMLAAAYRRIMPNDRLQLVERKNTTIGRRMDIGQPAVHKGTNSSLYCTTATGGLS
jgi:hypothetical protein